MLIPILIKKPLLVSRPARFFYGLIEIRGKGKFFSEFFINRDSGGFQLKRRVLRMEISCQLPGTMIEIETGKSDVIRNIRKDLNAEFDRVVIAYLCRGLEEKIAGILNNAYSAQLQPPITINLDH